MPFEAVHDRKSIVEKTRDGLSPKRIAGLLGMTPNQVSQVLYHVRKNPNYRHDASELRKILRHENLKNGKKAVDALARVIDSVDPKETMAVVRAAAEILDRAGVHPEQTKNTINVNVGLLKW